MGIVQRLEHQSPKLKMRFQDSLPMQWVDGRDGSIAQD